MKKLMLMMLVLFMVPVTAQALFIDGAIDYYTVRGNDEFSADVACWENMTVMDSYSYKSNSYLERVSDDSTYYKLYVNYGAGVWVLYEFDTVEVYEDCDIYRLQNVQTLSALPLLIE